MHELVHSILHSKLLSALRLPSFAGDGLSERMRSTSFALLGLTAAAGLGLVAIFAQPSFPLLSPAPLPAEPSARESIAEARTLSHDHRKVALSTALSAPAHHREAKAKVAAPVRGSSGPGGVGGGSGSDGGQVAPAEVDLPAPAPLSTPQPSSENSGGGGAGSGTGGGSDPAPAAAPAQPTPAPSTPVTAPQPKPKPEAITAAPKPEPAPAPGHSSSPAAAEHASERGIEASAGAGPRRAPPRPRLNPPSHPATAKGWRKAITSRRSG